MVRAVGHDGSLFVANASITGTITATSGQIGGLGINEQGLFCNNGNTGVGLWGTTAHANIAIHAGANTGNIGSAPFRVYHDGSLVATNANITGTVQASSGNIGKWEIFSEFIQATNSSNESSQITASGVWTNQEGDPEGASWHEIVFTCMGGSDEKLKHNIIDFNSSHDKFFDALVPKEFQYNNKQYLGSVQNAHFGFIYQNVLEASQSAHINNLALHWEENGYGKINKMEFIALNTWQIQKLKRRCEALECRLSKLESNTVR